MLYDFGNGDGRWRGDCEMKFPPNAKRAKIMNASERPTEAGPELCCDSILNVQRFKQDSALSVST